MMYAFKDELNQRAQSVVRFLENRIAQQIFLYLSTAAGTKSRA